MTIAEARIFAKLFPTKIVDKSWSGLLRSFNALFAPLSLFFFAKFLSFILLAAIIPVSEPEKKPLSKSKHTKLIIKNNKEGSSSIY